jgi:hypothetical protein
LGPALRRDFPDREAFSRATPQLIVEHSLHGIDIDKRATQLAALTLFLKAKSRNKEMRIERSNIVCAEAMPGDRRLFDDFKARKVGSPTGVLSRILDGVWEHLLLAGEAGSLLKAEEEISRLVAAEHAHWREIRRKGGEQQALFPGMQKTKQEWLDFSDVSDTAFWREVEGRIEHLLREYAEEASGAEGARRRMFARDSVEGLHFVEALRRHYDVALMNPPFGEPTIESGPYIRLRGCDHISRVRSRPRHAPLSCAPSRRGGCRPPPVRGPW